MRNLQSQPVHEEHKHKHHLSTEGNFLGPGFAYDNLSQIKEPTPYVPMNDLQSPQDLFFTPIDMADSPDNYSFKQSFEEESSSKLKNNSQFSINLNDLQNQPISKEDSEIIERISSFFQKMDLQI